MPTYLYVTDYLCCYGTISLLASYVLRSLAEKEKAFQKTPNLYACARSNASHTSTVST